MSNYLSNHLSLPEISNGNTVSVSSALPGLNSLNADSVQTQNRGTAFSSTDLPSMSNKTLENTQDSLSNAQLTSKFLNLNNTSSKSTAEKSDFVSGSGVLTSDAEISSDDLIDNNHKSNSQTNHSNQHRRTVQDTENLLETAKRIQLTNHTKVWKGSMDGSKAAELYRFDLTTNRSFDLKLKSSKQNTNVVLLDSSGQVAHESSCDCPGKPEVIKTVLNAGTYYVQVTEKGTKEAGNVIRKRNNASYELSMSTDPGKRPRTAQPIGLTATPATIKNSLSLTDQADWYRFDLATNNQFNLQLKGLKNNANATLLDQSGHAIQASHQPGRKSEAISSVLEAGTYYVKVAGQKCETPYRLTLSATDSSRSLTDPEQTTGIFTVGQSGQVSIDYLLDGSNLQGEVAIFNLNGMEQFEVGSDRWIQEAAFRAMKNAPDSGHVVTADQTEGARFDGSPGESNFNSGKHLGAKTFAMNPNSQFGIMLVPNGTVPSLLSTSNLTADQRPLFSIPAANLFKSTQFAQVLEVKAEQSDQVESSVISIEDTQLDQGSDRDYDDLVFQIKGAAGKLTPLEQVIDPAKEWRSTELGQQIEQFAVDAADPAGNTLNTSRGVNTATNGKTYRGWVGSTDTDDFYSFSLGTRNDFKLSLDGLTADANVELLGMDGKVIQGSANPGTTAEAINTTLDAGAYRIRVSSTAQGTPFNLSVFSTPLIKGITTTGSEAPIGVALNDSRSLIRVDDFRSGKTSRGSRSEFVGVDGKGHSIAVLDSGIDQNHPFFGSDKDNNGIRDRIVYQQDFVNNDMTAEDPIDDGHGTHVASIAASSDPKLTGIAPGADIIALKILEGDTEGGFAEAELALQWVLDNAEKYNIASVNLSFADTPKDVDRDGEKDDGIYNTAEQIKEAQKKYGIADELAALKARNVIAVSASGNSFAEHQEAQGVSYPSADPNSLSVGSVLDGGRYSSPADQISTFSQRSKDITDIFAPGESITAAHSDGGTLDRSGTSQAAPHVAGMVALAQQLAQKELKRQLTADEFRQLLYDSGVPIDDPVTGVKTFRRADMLSLANKIMALKPVEEPEEPEEPGNPPGKREIDLSSSLFFVDQKTFTPGNTINVKVRVQNTGSDDASPFDVDFYLSDDSNITQKDYFLGSRGPQIVSSGNGIWLVESLTLPTASDPIWKSFKDGSIYFGMIVDGSNVVAETNEKNNTISSERLQRENLTVTINHLTGDFDPIFNDSDFYALVSFSESPPNDEAFWLKSPTITGNDIRPNWKFSQSFTEAQVPITVRVYDDDEFLTFDNDWVDINPASEYRDLNLVYDFLTGQITGDLNGMVGDVLSSTGDGDDSGSIELTIGFDPTA